MGLRRRLYECALLGALGLMLPACVIVPDTGRSQLVLKAYGPSATYGVILPYSRKHELEADRLGLLYMARAGYDPRQAVEFWKRFDTHTAQQDKRPIELLSTHPLDSTRIRQLESLMPAAIAEYERTKSKH